MVAVTNSSKHDFNRCKSATCKFLFRDTKSARDKNGTKLRKNKVKNTSPKISLVEYLCFVCKGTNLSLEKRGEIPISLIHNSFSYHCTPNVVIANGFDLKRLGLRKLGVKFCFALCWTFSKYFKPAGKLIFFEKKGNSIYKSSELGKGRCLMPSKIEGTWAKLHHQELEEPVSTPTKNTQQPKIMTVPNPMPTADNTPKIRHFDFYTDEFHHYPVDIPQNCLDVIDKNIALDADNVFAKIGDVQKTAILLFAEYIDAATTIAAQSGGGGGGATSGWGRDKDEDELSWAHRCAMMANRLCRPRKKQGYGR